MASATLSRAMIAQLSGRLPVKGRGKAQREGSLLNGTMLLRALEQFDVVTPLCDPQACGSHALPSHTEANLHRQPRSALLALPLLALPIAARLTRSPLTRSPV